MNMKKILAFSLLILSSISYLQAQDEKPTFFGDLELDLTLNVGERTFMNATSANKIFGLGQKKKFKLGFGLRGSSFFGDRLHYTTAPAKITSGKTGPAVLFTENIEENIDSLLLGSSQVNFLNIDVHLGYAFSPKFDIGFNIDVIGFSFGKNQTNTATFISEGNNVSTPSAKPTTFNILLISDNDRGSLNSEIFGRYWINDKIGIKLGASFAFAEYTTNTKVQTEPESNDRFRYKSFMGMLGITWRPFIR
jgi:hypothetical protein